MALFNRILIVFFRILGIVGTLCEHYMGNSFHLKEGDILCKNSRRPYIKPSETLKSCQQALLNGRNTVSSINILYPRYCNHEISLNNVFSSMSHRNKCKNHFNYKNVDWTRQWTPKTMVKFKKTMAPFDQETQITEGPSVISKNVCVCGSNTKKNVLNKLARWNRS